MEDLSYYYSLLAKGIENLTLGEEYFVIEFDMDNLKNLHNFLRNEKMKLVKVEDKNVFLCRCKREYFIPCFHKICQFQKSLSSDYLEINNRKW